MNFDELNKTKPSSDMPFVSVVMPVRNECGFIERSLGAVLDQTYPHGLMEVIVADGMSTDDTRRRIEEMMRRTDIAVSVIDNPARTAPAALNLAIGASRGSIIIRVDGHCEIATDYVSNCVELLGLGIADGVGGPIETIAETPQAEAIAIAMGSKFGVGGSAFRTVHDRELEVDTIAFPGYKRNVFERLGGFNEELVRNQDDEFNYRLRKHGGRLFLSPTIKSRYYSRSSFHRLWKQYFQYGYWKVRVFQLHPGQMSLRQFIPLILVASLLVLGVLSLVSTASASLLLLVIASYLAANLVASILVCRTRGLRYVLRVSLSFAILHLAYGSGSLVGLLAFGHRWLEKKPASTLRPTI